MCKTYDAIKKLSKTVESDILVLWVDHKKVSGIYVDCNENKCFDEIITLQDAVVEDRKSMVDNNEKTEYKWLNIPSHHIKGFAFKCCIIGE